MQMRAAVLEAFGEPLVIQDVELEDPKPGEDLVRLVACGVCHTDLYTVAGVAGKGETLDIVPRHLITGRRVCGSSFGGVKGREQVPQLVQRYLDGEIDVAPFVSHRLTLDDVNRGFELMHAQDGIRSVIDF
jgi:Zn-dependent alcohol dehydrogenase